MKRLVAGSLGAGVLAVLVGCSAAPAAPNTPTPTPVSDAARVEHCTAYWLDMRPAHDDWSESITEQYVDQTSRMCEGIVADDDDAFARG